MVPCDFAVASLPPCSTQDYLVDFRALQGNVLPRMGCQESARYFHERTLALEGHFLVSLPVRQVPEHVCCILQAPSRHNGLAVSADSRPRHRVNEAVMLTSSQDDAEEALAARAESDSGEKHGTCG